MVTEEERQKLFIERINKQYKGVESTNGEEIFDLEKFRGEVLDAEDYLELHCKRFESGKLDEYKNQDPVWFYGDLIKSSLKTDRELEFKLKFELEDEFVVKCVDIGDKLGVKYSSIIEKDKLGIYIGPCRTSGLTVYGILIKPSRFAHLIREPIIDVYCIAYGDTPNWEAIYFPTGHFNQTLEQ